MRIEENSFDLKSSVSVDSVDIESKSFRRSTNWIKYWFIVQECIQLHSIFDNTMKFKTLWTAWCFCATRHQHRKDAVLEVIGGGGVWNSALTISRVEWILTAKRDTLERRETMILPCSVLQIQYLILIQTPNSRHRFLDWCTECNQETLMCRTLHKTSPQLLPPPFLNPIRTSSFSTRSNLVPPLQHLSILRKEFVRIFQPDFLIELNFYPTAHWKRDSIISLHPSSNGHFSQLQHHHHLPL